MSRSLHETNETVRLVGHKDWEPVPSLFPYVQAASVVVCSGYSTIMEAAIAGTPCIVYPFTNEQHGVARMIERGGVTGIQVAHSQAHVHRCIDQITEFPVRENGVNRIARLVMNDVHDR